MHTGSRALDTAFNIRGHNYRFSLIHATCMERTSAHCSLNLNHVFFSMLQLQLYDSTANRSTPIRL